MASITDDYKYNLQISQEIDVCLKHNKDWCINIKLPNN